LLAVSQEQPQVRSRLSHVPGADVVQPDRLVRSVGLQRLQVHDLPMIEINWARCTTVPRQHQKDGVVAPFKRRLFMLADEVGGGKSKQVVDASQFLCEELIPGTAQREIDTVVVLCPAFARGVWASLDPNMGEVAKHGWGSINNRIIEYSVKNPRVLKMELP